MGLERILGLWGVKEDKKGWSVLMGEYGCIIEVSSDRSEISGRRLECLWSHVIRTLAIANSISVPTRSESCALASLGGVHRLHASTVSRRQWIMPV